MSESELKKLSARIGALEGAIGYTLANISAKFSDTKPAVINQLKSDAKLNSEEYPELSHALIGLASLLEKFKADIRT